MKNLKQLTLAATIGLFSIGAANAMEITHEDVDLNKDGQVTEAEIINVVQAHFFSMDKDGDNHVSQAEWDHNDGEGGN